MIEIWTEIVGNGKREAWHPDLPGKYDADGDWTSDVPYTADEDAPTDFGGNYPNPATSLFNVLVDPADLPKIRAHLLTKGKDIIAEQDAPEADLRLVRMLQTCKTAGLLDLSGKAEAYFNSIPNIATANAARKTTIGEVLLQASARGLSEKQARAIRTKHGLPHTLAQIREASVGWQMRRYKLDRAAAIKVLDRKLGVQAGGI